MSAQPDTNFNWDDDDIDSEEDSSESGSDSEENEKNEEEDKKIETQYEHAKQRHGKYGDQRGPRNQGKGFSEGNPNSNYAMYYRNDPDFFVKVIRKVDPPHEIRIKMARGTDKYGPELSKSELSEVLQKFSIESPEIDRMGMDFIVNISIDDSKQAEEIY